MSTVIAGPWPGTPIGPTVAGGHVELDEEVTNQLTPPEPEDLSGTTLGAG